jgi:hypothetical protein
LPLVGLYSGSLCRGDFGLTDIENLQVVRIRFHKQFALKLCDGSEMGQYFCSFKQHKGTTMMKKIITPFVFMGLLLLMVTPAQSITWCHDYSFYKVTGKDANRTSPAALRKRLKELGYRSFPFTTAARDPKAQGKLKSGDIIIFGDDHSGVVNDKGLIDHFIQKYGASGTKYQPEQLDTMENFKRDWTLLQILNFERVMSDGRKLYPYKSKSVEVWRKVS